MAQASHHSEARPFFRFLAGILAAFGAVAVVGSLVMMVAWREWWPLSIIAGCLPGAYAAWRIARTGRG